MPRTVIFCEDVKVGDWVRHGWEILRHSDTEPFMKVIDIRPYPAGSEVLCLRVESVDGDQEIFMWNRLLPVEVVSEFDFNEMEGQND